MAGRLVCWKCGGALREVPRPIRRLSRCPHCRAELHTCRLCAHYDPRVLGECVHERAERVVDKTVANFCTYFRPRPDAHQPPPARKTDEAAAALGALFGVETDADKAAGRPDPQAGDKARRELDALFGITREEEAPPPPGGDGDHPAH